MVNVFLIGFKFTIRDDKIYEIRESLVKSLLAYDWIWLQKSARAICHFIVLVNG